MAEYLLEGKYTIGNIVCIYDKEERKIASMELFDLMNKNSNGKLLYQEWNVYKNIKGRII